MTSLMSPQPGEQRVQLHVAGQRVRYYWNPAKQTWRVWSPASRRFLAGTADDLTASRTAAAAAYGADNR